MDVMRTAAATSAAAARLRSRAGKPFLFPTGCLLASYWLPSCLLLVAFLFPTGESQWEPVCSLFVEACVCCACFPALACFTRHAEAFLSSHSRNIDAYSRRSSTCADTNLQSLCSRADATCPLLTEAVHTTFHAVTLL